MEFLRQFLIEANGIKDLLDQIEVKGEKNHTLILYAIQRCNTIINAVGTLTSSENQNGSENDKSSTERSEVNE